MLKGQIEMFAKPAKKKVFVHKVSTVEFLKILKESK
jgi:hypothetical protein